MAGLFFNSKNTYFTNGLLMLILSMIVLLIRWIPFTGTNDFGWTYDVANRMLSGSRLYSDISINIGPVSFLTLSWLMKLMGNSIIVYNMHLYIWYLLCIIASYYSLRKIVDREELFISLLIAVLIGFPVVNAFHVYNYSSTFFFILGVTALVKYQTRNHVKYIFFVGVIAVLCLLNKQNVGFAYFGLSNIFLVFHSIGRPIKNIISHLIVLYVSTLLSLITAAIIFEIYFDLGYGEFINVLLIEATSGKQGLVKIIARTIPWIKANIGGAKLISTIIISAITWAGIVKLVLRVMNSDNGILNKNKLYLKNNGVIFFLTILLLSIAGAFLVSPFPKYTINYILSNLGLHSWWRLILHVIYAFIFISISLKIYLLLKEVFGNKNIAAKNDILFMLGALVLTWSHTMGNTFYASFAFPIAIPLVIHYLNLKKFKKLMVIVPVILFTVWNISWPYAKSFEKFYKINLEAFNYTFSSIEDAGIYNYLSHDFVPTVNGKRTLLLGRSMAMTSLGIVPVDQPGYIWFDTVNRARFKAHLLNWISKPPDFIIEDEVTYSILYENENDYYTFRNTYYKQILASEVSNHVLYGLMDSPYVK